MNGTALFEETQGFAPWIYVLVGSVFVLLFSVLTLRQTTTVSGDAVTVHYGFLYRVRIPFSQIAHAEAIAYRPVRDYGGWGIRGLGSRRALSARGNQGVLVTRVDGSTVLIGSQKPRELLSAMSHGGVQTEDRLPAPVRDF